MSASHVYALQDMRRPNACPVCGIPLDANYFDVAGIQSAPLPGQEIELARYALHPQYCGVLLNFAQHAEPTAPQTQPIFKTPGYEWVILCNNQPRDPYLPTSLILNPWGANAFSVELRLEEGCELRFVVRKVRAPADEVEIPLAQVGGRLLGRHWYNNIHGGAPNRL